MSFKRRSLMAVCTLATISSLSFTAKASSGESVCSNPIQRICTDTTAERKVKDKQILNLKNEIAAEANINAAPRIEEMKKQVKFYHVIKRFLGSVKIRNQEIMKAAKKRMGGLEEVVTNSENIGKIKNYMYQSIESSSFDSATKANFKGIIESIVVGNFSDFLEKSNLENDVIAQFFGNACGSDGLVENAFATNLDGQRYVLICPGVLINASQTTSASQRFNNILQTISHEIGHHIDNSKVGNELYAPYLNCLAKNYSSSFLKSKNDEKYCKANLKEPSKCNDQVVLSHSGEMIADQWGIRATAIHAAAESYSVMDADQMLTDTWGRYCDTPGAISDEGIHPTGTFRIETLMRKNPSITSYLSCSSSETDSKPACSFDGESSI
ncbi:MAG: hypothetical protein Q7U04_14635 [Bacteriovorax sp.]|nr:hypothetical protein [Bacteriovorax sp.]